MKAVRVNRFGGPEVLEYQEIPRPELGPGEVLIRIEAAGINYIDTYQRTGLYKGEPPFTLGMEGSGIIEALGRGVSLFKPGQRVAYCMARGSYAEFAVVSADLLVPLQEGITFKTGASVLLQGMTAHYLVNSTYPVKKGTTLLLHAAGGVTGLLLIQMAKTLGAVVYGTASTQQKLDLALNAGADKVINYRSSDFTEEVMSFTDGRGVDVVYDSVGLSTYEKSLLCLKPRGMLVLFGQSSGAVPPFNLASLAPKSLYVSRPMLGSYIQDRRELEWRSSDLFSWITKGTLKIQQATEYPLSKAGDAHRALEDRNRVGKLLLIP